MTDERADAQQVLNSCVLALTRVAADLRVVARGCDDYGRRDDCNRIGQAVAILDRTIKRLAVYGPTAPANDDDLAPGGGSPGARERLAKA